MLSALDLFLKKATPKFIFWTTIIIDFILVFLVIFLAVIPMNARFTVDAISEKLIIEIIKGSVPLAWDDIPISVSQFRSSKSSINDLNKCKSPKFQFHRSFSSPITLIATSRGKNRYEMEVKSENNSTFGRILCENGTQSSAPNQVTLQWSENDATDTTLLFSGILTLGSSPTKNDRTPQLLRSGTLIIEAPSFPFKTGAVIEETVLRLGDRLRLFQERGANNQAISHGVVRMSNNAFHVVAHATAAEARILHPGQVESKPVNIAPTLWAKLESQAEWIIFILLGALILNILAALREYIMATND